MSHRPGHIEDTLGSEVSEKPRTASNREFVGFSQDGQQIWQVSDPDDPQGVGFYVLRQFPSGSQLVPALDEQVRFALQGPASSPRSGGTGTTVPFSFDRIPGVGIVSTDRRSGQVTLAFPEPQTPPDLQLEVDPQTGNLLTIDPTTGKVTDTGQRVGIPQLTPQQRRAQELEDFRLQSQQRAQEAEAARGFTASQSALDRAQRAAEFAAQQQLAQQGEARAQQSQRLQAAAQLADLVSLTDPAALQGFAAGGGFNIANAIAGGGDALSNAALLPAAQTLRAIQEMNRPQGFAAPGGPPVFEAPGAPQDLSLSQADWLARFRNDLAAGKGIGAVPGTPAAAAIQQLTDLGLGVPTPGGIAPFKPDFGSMTDLAGPIFAQSGFSGTVSEPTVFVAGENGPENVQVDPLDQPFIDRIRALRQRVKVPELLPGGPFNVGFANLPPTLQRRFFAARQSRYGVPIADQIAEAQRYMLSGAGRGFDFGL